MSSKTAANAVNIAASEREAAVKTEKSPVRDTVFFSETAVKTARSQAQNQPETTDPAAGVSEQSKTEASKEKSSLSDILEEQTEKINGLFSSGNSDTRLLSIRMKISRGNSLSPNEEAYFSIKDPNGYSNYRATQDARRMMRYQLSVCRTKDEVNGMRLSNALSALKAYKKAVKSGDGISAVADMNKALDREIVDFARSGRYNSLPTSAERNKFYMELAKARKYEREKRAAQQRNASDKKKKQIKFPGDGKRTVSQVENSPLGRKVRRSEKNGAIQFTMYS